MKYLERVLHVLIIAILLATTAHAQFFSVCQSGSKNELEVDIIAHSEHTWRMGEKIEKYYYSQRKLPPYMEKVAIKDVQDSLKDMGKDKGREVAVLFHAVGSDNKNLCTWLITGNKIVSHVVPAPTKYEIRNRHTNLLASLNIPRMAKSRTPVLRGAEAEEPEPPASKIPAKVALQQMSALLIPEPIADALDKDGIGTLVVVPVFGIGTFPFAAFNFRDGLLVDRMSVIVAPSFRIFSRYQRMTRQRQFFEPIVIGDPCENECYDDPIWKFTPLRGARREAVEVAEKFEDTKPLLGSNANRKNVQALLKDRGNAGLFFIATHGIADEINPNDDSFLLLSDSRWTARQIYNDVKASKLKNGFLVVMSACQTGLGKVFDVGNTGLARAWHMAGASNVVMSLWNVDDDATKLLMTRFVELAKSIPPDVALQEAMKEAKKNEKYSDPVYWAGFNVFGSP